MNDKTPDDGNVREDNIRRLIGQVEAEPAGDFESRLVGMVLPEVARQRRRRLIMRTGGAAVAAAAAACLVLGAYVWSGRDGQVQQPAPPVQAAQVALSGWRIQPIGGARYRIVKADRIRLAQGELLVESAGDAADRPTLTIETPVGDAAAAGTRFYIGTYVLGRNETKGTVMKQLTRILVLSGIVTLATEHGTVMGSAGELLAAESGKAPVKLAIRANSDFAFDLYARLAKENAGKNMFFSPYSISSALAMTVEGARGQTAAEMGKVLRFPAAARRIGKDAQMIPWRTSLIHTGMAALNARLTGEDDAGDKAIRAKIAEARKQHKAATRRVKELQERGTRDERKKALKAQHEITDKLNKLLTQVDQYELRIANALWGEQAYPFRQAYVETINKHYKAGGLFAADFRKNFERERRTINKWVLERTKEKIKELIPSGALDRLTRLVLANAIYFKGQWSEPFKEAETGPCDFTLAGGKKLRVATMRANRMGSARYGAFNADGSFFATPKKIRRGQRTGLYPGKDGFSLLELAYKGGDLSMALIAPNSADGLGAIESKLSAGSLNAWLGKLQKRQVHVLLPKFKLETDYDLGTTLQGMGMVQAFDIRRADFAGMSASSDPRQGLYISKVLHKAFVDVTEKGTEAAAATAVMMTKRSPPPARPLLVPFIPTFKADRPFIFAVRDRKTGNILFLGRVTNPTQ